MEYTPGPWHTAEMASLVWGKDENGSFPIAEIRGQEYLRIHHTDDEAMTIQIGNARIMAAAPEMYEMLIAIAAKSTTNYKRKIVALLRRIEGKEAPK